MFTGLKFARARGGLRYAGGLLGAGSLTLALLALGPVAPAVADTAPQDPTNPATPVTVSADSLPTVQINGVVWSQAVVGNTVYAGGSFSTARPAGAAAGTQQVTRNNLLAYNLETGVLIPSFAPNFNGQVRGIAASPDGTRLYVVGDFTTIDGVSHRRLAAFNTATNTIVQSFAPPMNYETWAVDATNTTVFVGGNWNAVGTQDRGNVAAFDTSGALLDWAPTVSGGIVRALALSPDNSKIAVGGSFTSANGSNNPGYGLAMFNTSTGASLPFGINSVLRDGGPDAAITSLATDGNHLYGGGYVFGPGGNFEGTFSAAWSDGSRRFMNDCHGDTYFVQPMNGVAYQVGHTHYCGNIGGFPQTVPSWTFNRATAFGTEVTGASMREPYGYANWIGAPNSSLQTWYPVINSGTYTGQDQGPWTLTSNSEYLVMGGEFTRINGVNQQGLARFAVPSKAPNKRPPRLFSTTYPLNVTTTATGAVRINWSTNEDDDNAYLTYKVYRDIQNNSGLLYTTQARADFWNPYGMGFTDTTAAPGSSHQYRVAVTDPAGNIANSPWVPITVASTGTLSNYVKAVYDSQPTDYWRFGETSGTNAADFVGFTPVTTRSGVSKNVAGAISGDSDRAYSFNGTSNGGAYSTARISPPNTFTIEAWFRTSTSFGGKLIGFGNNQTGNSSNYDRHIYLDNSGRVFFGLYNGSSQTINSPGTYRNNAWHHVVATSSRTAGMKLFIDGNLVAQRADVTYGQGGYWGYWRIGNDSLNSWPSDPISDNFNGSIDEVAIYKRDLAPAEISLHYAAGTGAPLPNLPPTAQYSSSANSLTLSVNGSASTDTDGTITNYAWDFGDGATGSGVTTTHTYANAGDYTVKLTVTDDDGATNVLSKTVHVNKPPVAAFTTNANGALLQVDGSTSTDQGGSITSYAWTYGDGGTGTGASSSHLYAAGGTYNVTLTVTDNEGATGTLTKPVQITLPNVAPDAAFTFTQNDLSVDVNGSDSDDPDGTISSYAWDYGDGDSDTGVNPGPHAYDNPGTYVITLTVTDNNGAPDSIAHSVTVTAPPAEFAVDEFERTSASGWGNATAGGAWVGAGAATTYTVGSGVGTIRLAAPGSGPQVYLNGVSSASTDLTFQQSIDKVSTGGGVYLTAQVRRIDAANLYYAQSRFLSNGTIQLALGRLVSGTDTALQSVATGLTVAPGDQTNVRVQAFGTSPTTIRAKVWRAGDPEPAAWTASTTDSSAALQAAGTVGLKAYLSGSATNAPVLASYDHLKAQTVP